MKKHNIYIALSALVLLSAACTREIEENIPGPGIDPGEGKAVFTFTPNFSDQPMTKGLSLNPEVKNIYFAVFDAAGYKLSEYAEAVPNSYATTNWDKDTPTKDIYSYSVELTITDKPRIIHIIANAPETLTYGTEDEVIGSLFTTLDAPETAMKKDGVTPKGTDRKDAYWCRIYLTDGVWAEPDEATKESDPTGYAAKRAKYMGVVNELKKARLVRNFSQITMTNYSTDNFLMTGFWLTNVPDLGSVAPYNRNTGKFVNNYSDYANVDTLRMVTGGNYQGFFPADASIISIAGTDGWQTAPVPETSALGLSKVSVGPDETLQHTGKSAFCYEREVPRANPLYIIVEGKFKTQKDIEDGKTWEEITATYYKIDLKDENDTYFPILRNFNYRVNISEVYRAGASTVEGALSSAPSGDISTSLDMSGLTNMSDGTSQIFVSETEVVLVGDGDVLLRYEYIPNLKVKDANGIPVAVNDTTEALTAAQITEVQSWTEATEASTVKTLWEALTKSQRMTLWAVLDPIAKTNVSNKLDESYPSGWKGEGPDKFPYLKTAAVDSSKYVTIIRTPGESGAVFKDQKVKTANETADNYREITLKPVDPSAVVKTETVTITGHFWKKEKGVYKDYTMTRVVTYRLREKLTMTASCSPAKITDEKESQVAVVIGLESGLPSSIFSLNLDIEAKNKSLTGDNTVSGNDLPVNSGASTIEGNSKPSYWFTRTITWTEYDSATPAADGKKYFTAYFKTSKAGTQKDTIYVSNKYFNQASTDYSRYTAKGFTNASFSGALAVGTDVDFKFDMEAFEGSSYTVQIGMKGIEPAAGETQLTYVGTSDGLEVYTMTVTSNTGNSIQLAPYKSGTDAVEVRLLADEYTTSSVKASPLESPIYMYVDINGTDGSAIDLVALNGADVTGSNQLTVGQTGKLTVYVSESATSIQIGSLTANRKTSGSGATITKDGRTYYAYTTNNNYTAPSKSGSGGAGYDELIVKLNGANIGTIDVPVWGIRRSTTALGNNAPSTSTWYIFYNNGRERYLYKNNTTLALRTENNNYDALMQFTSNGTDTKVFCASANQQVVGTNGNFSFGASGTTYTWASKHTQLTWKSSGGGGSGTTYYWRGDSTTAAKMSSETSSSTRNNWTFYPVTIVNPAS